MSKSTSAQLHIIRKSRDSSFPQRKRKPLADKTAFWGQLGSPSLEVTVPGLTTCTLSRMEASAPQSLGTLRKTSGLDSSGFSFTEKLVLWLAGEHHRECKMDPKPYLLFLNPQLKEGYRKGLDLEERNVWKKFFEGSCCLFILLPPPPPHIDGRCKVLYSPSQT